jgi:predicted ArsR family transcriptional regulator
MHDDRREGGGAGNGATPERPAISADGVTTDGATMGVMAPVDDELERARALGDPTRLAIFRRIEQAGGVPVDVATLTTHVGLHHTAVRQHLAKLRAAGLVAEEQLPAAGRGRPRHGFRLVAPPPVPANADGYRHLAALLAEAVRTGRPVREVGRDAGRAAAEAQPYAAAADPVEVLLGEATRLGFDPVLEGDEVILRTCPYAEVAAEDPATVCSVHLGLAEGIADAVGSLTITGLQPLDPRTGGCRLGVQHPPPPDSAPPFDGAERPGRPAQARPVGGAAGR